MNDLDSTGTGEKGKSSGDYAVIGATWPPVPANNDPSVAQAGQRETAGGSIVLGILVTPVPYFVFTTVLPLCVSLTHPILTSKIVGYIIEILAFFGPTVLCGIAAWRIPRHRKTYIGAMIGTVIGFGVDILIFKIADSVAGGALGS